MKFISYHIIHLEIQQIPTYVPYCFSYVIGNICVSVFPSGPMDEERQIEPYYQLAMNDTPLLSLTTTYGSLIVSGLTPQYSGAYHHRIALHW